jgi:Flp pilus assembly protein TadD
MPHFLIWLASGAALLLARRLYNRQSARVAADLARAREAMDRREAETVIPLECDPATGIYRPKQLS